MAKYFISYIGGNPPQTPEQGQQHFARYKAWLAELGEAVVSPANPLKQTHSINPQGEVSNQSVTQMSGYTVVEAETMEAALAMAKSCPFLEIQGTLEVSEMVSMPV